MVGGELYIRNTKQKQKTFIWRLYLMSYGNVVIQIHNFTFALMSSAAFANQYNTTVCSYRSHHNASAISSPKRDRSFVKKNDLH